MMSQNFVRCVDVLVFLNTANATFAANCCAQVHKFNYIPHVTKMVHSLAEIQNS